MSGGNSSGQAGKQELEVEPKVLPETSRSLANSELLVDLEYEEV